MEKVFLCADLYDAAFLLSYGAKFKRIESYYKNHKGKSFSVMSLTDVTWEMLQLLQDGKSTVNFHKFKEYRKRVKSKAEKYATEHEHSEINSREVYKIRQQLNKQLTEYKQMYSSPGPKRVMTIEGQNDEQSTITSVPSSPLGS